MHDLEKLQDNPAIDSWLKSGRIPGPGDPPVTWKENQRWLYDRIVRGDDFAIATDPALLPSLKGFIPGTPNGYFTARELNMLQQQGIEVTRIVPIN